MADGALNRAGRKELVSAPAGPHASDGFEMTRCAAPRCSPPPSGSPEMEVRFICNECQNREMMVYGYDVAVVQPDHVPTDR